MSTSHERNMIGPGHKDEQNGIRVVLTLIPDHEILPPPLAPMPTKSESKTNSPPPAIAPFDEAQAKAHQQAWADYLGVPAEFTNSLGMEFVLIPPGEFQMGAELAEFEPEIRSWVNDDNYKRFLNPHLSHTPAHRVTLTQPFYVQRGEVQTNQYRTVMGSVPKGNDDESLSSGIGLIDAVRFCNALSQHEQRTSSYRINDKQMDWVREATGYRLPTEAEWEFAVRAGTTTPWVFDHRSLDKSAYSNKIFTYQSYRMSDSPKPNAFGLINFYGISSEWCFDNPRKYTRDHATDPFENPSYETAVARGGSRYHESGGSPAVNSVARFPLPCYDTRKTQGWDAWSCPFPCPGSTRKQAQHPVLPPSPPSPRSTKPRLKAISRDERITSNYQLRNKLNCPGGKDDIHTHPSWRISDGNKRLRPRTVHRRCES